MQQTVTQQELISLLNSHLYQLGWTWQHPRIKSYLDKVANRLLVFQFQSLEEVPVDYLTRLVKLTELYYHCDRLLKMMSKDWSDQDVQKIITSYGYFAQGITVPKKVFCTLRKFQVSETTIFRSHLIKTGERKKVWESS